MKIFPEKNLLIDEFETVKQTASKYCISTMAIEKMLELQPVNNFETIQTWLQQTNEFKHIIDNGHYFPSDGYDDIRKELNLLRIDNAVLQSDQCLRILSITKTAFEVLRFFKEKDEMYRHLISLTVGLKIEKQIIVFIEEVFDDLGLVKSSASEDLARIRRSITRKRIETDRAYQSAISKFRKSGWLAEMEESSRNGRRVIAIVAEQKRNLAGLVHDISATGKTVYLEPTEAMELNNLVQSLEAEERNEILKILRTLSANLRKYQAELNGYFQMLSEMDFIRAKASYAVSLKARLPFFKNEQRIELHNARHPVLFLYHQSLTKKTIPFSLSLDSKNRIIVISGPNAGGKTVCMKTTALLQVMLQSGLLVSVDEHSTFGMFKKLLVDIGDSQSIEYELSTYSSRLKLMQEFLSEADKETLFIIDEFGTGTDPELGGALAEAILEELNQRNSFGLITTHYINLKVAADNTPGLINGCMAFDPQRLEPLYELIVGKPGSSYTFVVAERSGLPKHVIKNAASKVSKNHVLLEKLLSKVESDKNKITTKLREIQSAEETLNELLTRYQKLSSESENAKQKMDSQIRQIEIKLVKQFDSKMQKFVNEWKNTKDKKLVLDKYKNLYSKQKTEMSINEKIEEEKLLKEYAEKIKPGVLVTLKGGSTIGKVSQIQNTKVTVMFGAIKTISDIKQLVPVDVQEIPEKVLKKLMD